MPVYIAPFVIVIGIFMVGFAFLRPATEFQDDRHTPWKRIGWPVANGIGYLPVPVARAIYVVIGVVICAGGIDRLVS